jgi:hypothetical protein
MRKKANGKRKRMKKKIKRVRMKKNKRASECESNRIRERKGMKEKENEC